MALIPARDMGDVESIGNQSGTNDDGSSRKPFTNSDGIPTDPASVLIQILKPDGTLLKYGWPIDAADGGLQHESAGRFFVREVLDQPLRWVWNMSGTGGVQASTGDGELFVRPSVFS